MKKKKVLGEVEKEEKKKSSAGGLDVSSFVHTGTKQETGIIPLDLVMGGGFVPGDMIEIASMSGIGKSHTVLDLSSRFCEKGQRVLYLDVEGGVNASHLTDPKGFNLSRFQDVVTLEKLVNKAEKGDSFQISDLKGDFVLLHPKTYHDLDWIFNEVVFERKGNFDHIVIDSITAFVPRGWKDDKSSIEDHTIGADARIVSRFYRKYKGWLNVQKITTWIINQMRVKSKGSGQYMTMGVEAAGGNAQQHFPDIRLQLRSGEQIKKEVRSLGVVQEVVMGNRAILMAEKCRYKNPKIPVLYPVYFGKGISNAEFLLGVAQGVNLLKGGQGGRYTLHLKGDKEIKIHGKKSLLSAVRRHMMELKETLEDMGALDLFSEDVEEEYEEDKESAESVEG